MRLTTGQLHTKGLQYVLAQCRWGMSACYLLPTTISQHLQVEDEKCTHHAACNHTGTTVQPKTYRVVCYWPTQLKQPRWSTKQLPERPVCMTSDP